MNIQIDWWRTQDDDGKYLGHFSTVEEAEQWMIDQVNRYVHTPNPNKMSIARICREAKKDGIALYEQTFRNVLRRANVKIRNSQPKQTTHQTKTYSVSNYVADELEGYSNKSGLVDLGLRLVLGIPTEDVVVLLPEDDGTNTTLIFTKHKKGRITMETSGSIDRKFEQQIRMLMQRVNKLGMEAVINWAKTSGFKFYGGTIV